MSIPSDIDKDRLEYLLTRVEQQEITRQEAVELMPMLERISYTGMLRIGLGIFITKAKNGTDTWRAVRERLGVT